METKNVGQEVLERVVAKLGGPEAAALHLGVAPTLLERMMRGALRVPDQVLLKAMDLAVGEVQPLPAVAKFTPPTGKPVI